jgi:uncharacterized membrane protein
LASLINDFFGVRGTRYSESRQPDLVEKLCGVLALVLLFFAAYALFKGRDDWHKQSSILFLHLGTIAVPLALTPVMMWRKRGDGLHRLLGWIWAVCMFVTALISLNLRQINAGGFSYIHLLSLLTIIMVPALIISARRKDIKRHRSKARGFVIGALLIAGFFTFPFNRLLGSWLFS